MSVAIVTGSAGLIGSEACRSFAEIGLEVVGIDNNIRESFFGADGSTIENREWLKRDLGASYVHHDIDIRDRDAIARALRAVRVGHRPCRAHGRAAFARLGDASPVRRFRHQRFRHAQHAGGDARSTRPKRRSSSHRPTRSTGTRRTASRSLNWRRDGRSIRLTPTSAGSARTCRSTAPCTASSVHRRSRPT